MNPGSTFIIIKRYSLSDKSALCCTRHAMPGSGISAADKDSHAGEHARLQMSARLDDDLPRR